MRIEAITTCENPPEDVDVKDLEPGKWVQIGNWLDAEAAKGLIRDAIERARS